jgi:hypothetical protein
MSGIHVELDPEALAPLVRAIVAEVLAATEADRGLVGGDLVYSEAEAAALLKLHEHQLRDERLRGKIGASSIVGRRIRYTREDLVRYLAERRWQPGGNGKHHGGGRRGHGG